MKNENDNLQNSPAIEKCREIKTIALGLMTALEQAEEVLEIGGCYEDCFFLVENTSSMTLEQEFLLMTFPGQLKSILKQQVNQSKTLIALNNTYSELVYDYLYQIRRHYVALQIISDYILGCRESSEIQSTFDHQQVFAESMNILLYLQEKRQQANAAFQQLLAEVTRLSKLAVINESEALAA